MGPDRLSPASRQFRSPRVPVALLYWMVGLVLTASLVLAATGRMNTRVALNSNPGSNPGGSELDRLYGAPLLLEVLIDHIPSPTPTPTLAPTSTAVPALPGRGLVPTFTPTAPAILPTVTPHIIPQPGAHLLLNTPTPTAQMGGQIP